MKIRRGSDEVPDVEPPFDLPFVHPPGIRTSGAYGIGSTCGTPAHFAVTTGGGMTPAGSFHEDIVISPLRIHCRGFR